MLSNRLLFDTMHSDDFSTPDTIGSRRIRQFLLIMTDRFWQHRSDRNLENPMIENHRKIIEIIGKWRERFDRILLSEAIGFSPHPIGSDLVTSTWVDLQFLFDRKKWIEKERRKKKKILTKLNFTWVNRIFLF